MTNPFHPGDIVRKIGGSDTRYKVTCLMGNNRMLLNYEDQNRAEAQRQDMPVYSVDYERVAE